MTKMIHEWKCKACGAWVNMASMRHYHSTSRNMTLEEMREARERGEASMEIVDTTTETWTPAHERRYAPPTITD